MGSCAGQGQLHLVKWDLTSIPHTACSPAYRGQPISGLFTGAALAAESTLCCDHHSTVLLGGGVVKPE